ncbi:MAG: hypothetical protein HN742_12745 [Lentisphaerae bacterium]|jgi:hypothetical protein|nr:hypothetical protein [Lentisphaerota bacterium]MBT5607381.1 hypothetical protein [Lentisphaerota bacterium]MBT7057813.1 hypothetical protein [Lentisphaerota bacterium]MBT7842737.1 hypothetical protein [Lentisphaerota bacterium]
MGKTYASIEINTSLEMCYTYVRNSVDDPKFAAVYRTLHEGREYSGKIAEESTNRQIVIEEAGIDSVTRVRHKGWTITYDLEEVTRGTTRVGISVEYGMFLAVMGMTTVKVQSMNEVLSRVNALLALEYSGKTPEREPAVARDG